MSEVTEFVAPFYNIRAVAVHGRAFVGVDHTKPSFQDLHVGASVHTWIFTRVQAEGGVYYLSLKDSYQYIGAGDHGHIIATIDHENNREWRFKYWSELDAFTIEPNDQFRPSRAWTLSSLAHDAKIVLGNYVLFPSKAQLFKIENA